ARTLREAGSAAAHRDTAPKGACHRTIRERDRVRRESERSRIACAHADDRGVSREAPARGRMSGPARWTKVADITAAVRRRWDDGTLLRSFAQQEPFPRIEVPLRGPSAADLGEHFDEARSWSHGVRTASRDGRAYDIVE